MRQEGSLLIRPNVSLHVTETHNDDAVSEIELISFPSIRGRPPEVIVSLPGPRFLLSPCSAISRSIPCGQGSSPPGPHSCRKMKAYSSALYQGHYNQVPQTEWFNQRNLSFHNFGSWDRSRCEWGWCDTCLLGF